MAFPLSVVLMTMLRRWTAMTAFTSAVSAVASIAVLEYYLRFSFSMRTSGVDATDCQT